MKNLIGGTVLFIVALAAALAITLPARWALQFAPLPPGLRLEGVSGSIWNGQADTARWQQLPPLTVTWRVAPLSLLGGRLSANVTARRAGFDFAGTVTVHPDQSVRFTDATLDADVRTLPLPSDRMLATPEGRLRAEIPALLLTGNTVTEIDGNAWWKPARITAPVHYELGEVELRLKGQGGNINGQLTGRNGPIDADGTLLLNPQGQLQANLKLSPKPDTAKELRDLLPMLGRPAPDGSVTVRQTLQLPGMAMAGAALPLPSRR